MKFNELQIQMQNTVDKKNSKKAFTDWCKANIEVLEYIGISKKYLVIKSFASIFNRDYLTTLLNGETAISTSSFYLEYDIACLFRIMFEYINVDIERVDMTMENYDLIFQSGFYAYIISKCKEDYLITKDKCDIVIGIRDITIIHKLNEIVKKNFSINEFAELLDKFGGIMTDETFSKNLEFIEKFEDFNNSAKVKKVTESLTKKGMI